MTIGEVAQDPLTSPPSDPYTDSSSHHTAMRIQTPTAIQHLVYAGIDTHAVAAPGDELLGLSLGRLYVGVYPTATGFELAYGILNSQGCL